jgi:hypothetical protein
MLVAEKMVVQGFHYPFPGLARVEKAESGLSGGARDVEPDAPKGDAATSITAFQC